MLKRKRELLYQKSNFMLSFMLKISRIRQKNRFGCFAKRTEVRYIHNNFNFWVNSFNHTQEERARMAVYSCLLSNHYDREFGEGCEVVHKKFDLICD